MIQYIILAHSREHPKICDLKIDEFWHLLSAQAILPLKRVHELGQAYEFLKLAEGAVRLTTKQGFDAQKASGNQRARIAEFFGEEKFEAVQEKLFAIQTLVNENFKHMFEGK
jgi:glutamine synthetase adenylyltransferase